MSLGGPRLAYSLSKALNLPSISTTREHSETPQITPSIAFPTRAEISQNVQALRSVGILGDKLRTRGFSFQIDEIALEERPRYESSRDAILGMAREDADSCDLSTVTLETLHAAADALEDGSLTIAKEATVLTVAAFDSEHYAAFPIMISGTNKSEDDILQARWIQTALDVWEAEGDGDVWSVASDGDATRRRALHRLFMCRELQPTPDSTPSIYNLLKPLSRLNLGCGEKERTLSIDYKHKFKSKSRHSDCMTIVCTLTPPPDFASLLRLPAGLLVADEHIQSTHLRDLLGSVLNYSTSKLTRLFDNKDHQNVPNAVALLSAVRMLSEEVDFAKSVENRAIVLLGHFIGFLLDPFTIPTLSLSEQLSSLSAAAHTLFILYRRNRTSFCPGQWYYDVQSLIKSIFITVAKQKILDPSAEYHITLDGTDRLENNFGIYRDISGPGSNVDILQLGQRAALAAGIAQIYTKHPEWDRGHKRLRLEGVDGVDHTNPRSWKGDVSVRSVSLLTSWKNGLRTVKTLFDSLHIPFENIEDFENHIDLLRPFGSFVGLTDKDFNYVDGDTNPTEPNPIAIALDADPSQVENLGEPDTLVELEDVLPEVGNDDIDGVRRDDRFWINIEGKPVHKASAVRCFLNRLDGGRKSTDRTSRVQGVLKVRTYSRAPSAPRIDDDSIIGPQLLLGDFVATFVRIKNAACLAVVRVSEIRTEAKISVPSIPLTALSSPEVILRGQVLTLEAGKSTKTTAPSDTWIWLGVYESFNSSSTSPLPSRAASKKSTILELRACITQPIKSRLVQTDEDPSSNAETVRFLRVFDSDSLNALSDLMWDQVKSYRQHILSFEATQSYPPRASDGEYMLTTLPATTVSLMLCCTRYIHVH